MQIVILAGGLASRLGAHAERTPKAMICFEDKPFLQYQIELLKKQAITDIILCVGHLGEQIESYFRDGRQFGVRIRYSWEQEKLLGTGGALKNAEALLEEVFFVMYGDSYLALDYHDIERKCRQFPESGLMVVYRNENQYDRSNVAIADGLVVKYDNDNQGNFVYIDDGVSVLKKEFLNPFSRHEYFPLGDVFKQLIGLKKLRAYETKQRFYEIGSEAGLNEFAAKIKKETIP